MFVRHLSYNLVFILAPGIILCTKSCLERKVEIPLFFAVPRFSRKTEKTQTKHHVNSATKEEQQWTLE